MESPHPGVYSSHPQGGWQPTADSYREWNNEDLNPRMSHWTYAQELVSYKKTSFIGWRHRISPNGVTSRKPYCHFHRGQWPGPTPPSCLSSAFVSGSFPHLEDSPCILLHVVLQMCWPRAQRLNQRDLGLNPTSAIKHQLSDLNCVPLLLWASDSPSE
uniref:Uncharacterized protein n=1 Tax=Cercocebus atys TaxID=9531 RepID=A0A2K5MM38_CERAT